MAPVGDPLAGELPVPEVGRRDGVGVCALSTGDVAPVEVGGEKTGIQRVSWCLELEDWAKADVMLVNMEREIMLYPIVQFSMQQI